jgi:copper transport protein
VHLVRVVGRQPDAEGQWRRLRSAVLDEAVLLVLVLATTGLLTSLSPTAPVTPAREATTVSGAGLQRVQLGAGSLQGQLTPARVGTNDLELNLRDASGGPLITEAPPVVSATLTDGSLGPLPATVQPREENGRYRADLVLPTAGRWRVQVSVRIDRYTEPTAVLLVDVTD